eukprot:TRINITY_DN73082_c0_g1_i1.p1 TRINITY_DN73082_c0_g1~~TRINITY_DN73082_c0_g1_i1.p1  ORF type:complete len:558 (+),score=102.90 TRINITY_DN73082_c0_g1_i1:38-1711(+)
MPPRKRTGGRSSSESVKEPVKTKSDEKRFRWQICFAVLVLVLVVVLITRFFVVEETTPDCSLPRLTFDKVATHFAKDYRHKRPVVLEGLLDNWPVMTWKLGTWQTSLQNVTLPLRTSVYATVSGGSSTADAVSAADFLSARHSKDKSLVFHTERSNSDIPEFLEGLRAGGHISELNELSDVSLSPVLSMGGADTGLGYHQHDEAWLALVRGKKQWFLRSPESPGETYYRRVEEETLQDEPGVLKCLQRPGEVIYFPEGWWHATYNRPEEDELTVGIGGQGNAAGLKGIIFRDDLKSLETQLVGMEQSQLDELVEDAVNSGHVSMMEALAKRGAKAKSIMPAAFSGHAPALTWLLRSGGARLAPEQKEALKVSSVRGHVSILQRLLELRAATSPSAGAAVELETLASLHGHVPVLKLLADHGLSRPGTPSPEREGKTPLQEAVSAGHEQVVAHLLRRGASAKVEDNSGTSPLHLAALRGHTELLLLLAGGTGHGLELEEVEMTAYLAAASGHTSVLDWTLRQYPAASQTVRDAVAVRLSQPGDDAKHASARRWLERQG